MVYAYSLNNNFLFDDEVLTVNNRVVVDGKIASLIKSYRPIRHISYAIDYHLIGNDPWCFRLMNIFYHSLTTIAVYWLFMLLGMSGPASLFGAFIFAVHPIHSDAVAYISGRRDLLTALFYVLSLNFFILFYNKRKEWIQKKLQVCLFLLLSIAAMLLSFFSKEVGATIPLAWLLYIYSRRGNALFKTTWFYALAMVLTATFSIFGIFAVQQGGSSFVKLNSLRFHGDNPIVHYMTALTLPIYYIKQTLFPLQLIFDNINYPLVKKVGPKLIFSILGIISYFLVILKMSTKSERAYILRESYGTPEGKKVEKASLIVFFMLFFILSLAPVLQIIPLHEIVAEHYLYLPSLSFCGLLGMGFGWMWQRYRAGKSEKIVAFFMFSFIALSMFFVWRTVERNSELQNWWNVIHEDMKWREPSFRNLYTLAGEYSKLKLPDRGFKLLRRSVETGVVDAGLNNNILRYFIDKGYVEKAKAFADSIIKDSYHVDHEYLPFNFAYTYFMSGDCQKVKYWMKRVGKNTGNKNGNPLYNDMKICMDFKNTDSSKRDIVKDLNVLFRDNYSDKKNLELVYEKLKKYPYQYRIKKKIIRSLLKYEIKNDLRLTYIIDMARTCFVNDYEEALNYYIMARYIMKLMGKSDDYGVNESINALENYIEDITVKNKYYPIDV